MKNVSLFLLFSLTIIAAKCDNESVGEYFQRPEFRQCILLEDTRLMACDGKLIQTRPGQIVMQDFDAEDEMTDYYMDKEERLFICLKFGQKRCK